MRPRLVYGKRKKAIYDPVAVFDSSPKDASPEVKVKVIELVKNVEALNLDGVGKAVKNEKERRALGELNHNARVKPILPKSERSRKPRKGRRKIVVEDDESERSNDGPSKDRAASETGDVLLGDNSRQVVDNVPLFCDGHGYESADDEDAAQESVEGRSKDEELTNQEQPGKSLMKTLSIDISPPTPPPTHESNQHCAELLEQSSHGIVTFSDWAHELSTHFKITKIAEASFGEVYRLSLRKRLSDLATEDESVLKIIPLKPAGTTLPLDKRKRQAMTKKIASMSSPADVANEVRLLQRMASIPGFTNFRDIRVIQGRPPRPFQEAYKVFNASQKARKKDLSHFPDPSKPASYADSQLFAVIEMQDAGTDLEQLVEQGAGTSMFFVWDIFWLVTLTLTKGEEGAEFEHRDLHLGNICVRQPSAEGHDNDNAIDTKRKLNFTSSDITIIDYTISRAGMPDNSVAYHDLATDSAIFEGDSTEEYQYDIYRYMRGAVLCDDPYAEITNPPQEPSAKSAKLHDRSWEQYHPKTNLIWLHYILYKLLEQVAWPSAVRPPPRRQKGEYAQWKRGNDLEHVVLRVQDLLDPGALCEEGGALKSTSDLVGLAIGEGWLDEEDYVGAGGPEEGGIVEEFEGLEITCRDDGR